MFCEFIQLSYNSYKRNNCGLQISTNDDQPPIFPCSALQISSSMPDLVNQIKSFSSIEYSDQTLNDGMASNELIESRFRICESCEFFQNKTCSQCGCIINRVRNHMNKLSLANEECPIKRW